jgi:hypothetical protein
MQIAIAAANQRDGPCTSAASFEARCRLHLRMTVYVRHIFIDVSPRLCYGENARSFEGRHR